MTRAGLRKTKQATHFAGTSAIVTEGASGIGKVLATELVARGATVLVADIDESGAAAVAEALYGLGTGPGSARSVGLDVTDADAVAGVVDRFAADHDGLDFLFNNAGIGGPALPGRPEVGVPRNGAGLHSRAPERHPRGPH